jgi:hypothetical protein
MLLYVYGSMSKRNIIIIHRGPEYQRDFDEIGAKVNALDRSITVYHLPNTLKAELPETAWHHPTVTVSLAPDFRLPVRRGPVLRNHPIEKLAQQDIFRKNAIPTPPALAFEPGMKFDPLLFGDFLMLKPIDLGLTSSGEGIFVFRRKRLENLRLSDLPASHPLRGPDRFIVQKFIPTGEFPFNFRATTFLGEVLNVERYTSTTRCPPLTADDGLIEAADYSTKNTRRYAVEKDSEVEVLARRTAACFPSIPLLGIDILRDVAGQLHVIEVNAGGNTWHYSSKAYNTHRWQNPKYYKGMREQFGAFDVAARRLVDIARAQAS